MRLTLIVALGWVLGASSLASVIYVDSRAVDGGNDGSSWGDAFIDLQDALDASTGVQEIWVAGGPYVPARDIFGQTTNDETATFVLRGPIVRIYGGFLGNEKFRAERNAFVNRTVLSGRKSRRHIVLADAAFGVDDKSVFDGFMIAGGNADGIPGNGDATGGGMAVFGAGITIANCDFVANEARGGGGGLYASNAYVKAVNCQFRANNAGFNGHDGVGGALLVDGPALLINCLIESNYAGVDGIGHGAFFASDPNDPTELVHCTFADNGPPEPSGSGGAFAVSGEVSMVNSIVWHNRAAIDPAIAITDPNDAVLVSYSDIQGGWPGPGNISADPRFASRANHSFRLTVGSPCVDVGDLGAMYPDFADLDQDGDVSELLPADLELTQRLVGSGLNLGAFETFDCQGNNIGDVIEIMSGAVRDCNGNDIPDECDIRDCPGDPWCADCNGNGRLDPCDLDECSGDPSCSDCNNNLLMDGCEGPAGRLFVDRNRKGSGTGGSWEDAYAQLEDAFCAVRAQPERRFEIWIARGEYRPSTRDLRSDRYASFQIPGNAALFGGFFGNETSLEQRSIDSYPTILSGDHGRNNDDSGNGRFEDAYHVVECFSGAPVLDGITITGGTADGPTESVADAGGGVLVHGGSVTLRRVTLRGNQALAGGAVALLAGELHADACIFLANEAPLGAAALAAGESALRLTSSLVNANGARLLGAAVVVHSASAAIVNCTIVNSAGGSIRVMQHGLIRGVNSIIWDNGSLPPLADGVIDLNFCALEHGAGGEGNIKDDPLFVDRDGPDGRSGTLDDDFRVQNGSPCLDAGLSDAAGLPALDLDGQPRERQCRVDIGAYESAFFADCDGNGASDACQILEFPARDCNGDRVLDRCQTPYADCDENDVNDACQPDRDGDGSIDACDACPDNALKTTAGACGCGTADVDSDFDGVPDCVDNCPTRFNPDQRDGNGNGRGNACDSLLSLGPCPGEMTVAANDSAGAVVSFELPAALNDSGNARVVADPAPGSFFPVGPTRVRVTATDDAGGSAECSFTVTVLAADEVERPVPSDECPPLYRLNSGALSFFGIPIGCGPGCLASVSLTFVGLMGMRRNRR